MTSRDAVDARNARLVNSLLRRLRAEMLSNGRVGRYLAYAASLNDPATADAHLLRAADHFFTTGWVFPEFEPITTTFDDLEGTGNLQVIRNSELRESLSALYGMYRQVRTAVVGNEEWARPLDSQVSAEFDVMRWDPRTAVLFP